MHSYTFTAEFENYYVSFRGDIGEMVNVYIYNVQPNIEIDYSNGYSKLKQ